MRFVSEILAVIGFFILFLGVVVLVSTSKGLDFADEAEALAPLVKLPLDQVGNQSLKAINIVIPHTTQWKRFRAKWGEPEFIVSAVSSEQKLAYCLADLEMGIKVYEHGTTIPVAVSYSPYGYSGCGNSSLIFRVLLETNEVELTVVKLGQLPLPSGQLIVVGDWPPMKDKLVGDAIDKDLRPIAKAMSVIGIAVISLAAYVQLRRNLRQRS